MRPKVGLNYSECVTRINRIKSNPGHPQAKANIINSIKNQCRLAEGEKANHELERECALKNEFSVSSAAGLKNRYGKVTSIFDQKTKKWIKVE